MLLDTVEADSLPTYRLVGKYSVLVSVIDKMRIYKTKQTACNLVK